MRFVLLAVVLFVSLFANPDRTQDPAQDPGRVATVVDRQGQALVRPVGRERWTPLAQRSPIIAGDLLRTEPRGANAIELALANGGSLVLGPGALVEVVATNDVRVLRGELEITGTAKAPVRVRAPGGFDRQLSKRTVLAASETATAEPASAPRWLTGYRASTTDEWLGSLLAKVDGREVALSVGYHKVDAVIRDQIAETTIEESFVNATDSRLEGTFTFPLPADASISGFGMWIGNELVEADIVEKQRARQIYEEILRLRKDPGLLEWSGGNLFKARVFPIEAHSEKRIRLRYTQVLPLTGSAFAYRYALKSELLRARPLRQLAIKISVDSTLPIQDAVSTTHPVRARKTAHNAVLEYDASEVTPERDFEARVTLDAQAPLTVVPHRRGEDGYFMLLLRAPDGGAGLQRELVPEGAPLRLLVIADTSGSMNESARKTQSAFIAALLAQLAPKDRFELWSSDVGVRGFAAEPRAADEKSTGEALAWLARHDSLGWTDLDLAFDEVKRRAQPGTQVVYVGDGIGTAGAIDPVALGQRLTRIALPSGVTCHAVAVDASHEARVLESIGSLGGGSVRACDDDPARAAQALLTEVAQPAAKDLKVAFEGLRTARVYPERMPNLPQGSQQVVLGRFLPIGKEQRGKVEVTGSLAGKPVRYTAEVKIAEGEEGNSFLPRLWARRHLDALLARGTAKAVVEDIVAFSTEFAIMTPFTSFLVLESDADRERYGVARRVRMRDGEAFFAEGKDRASTEILREQMRVARTWRLHWKERAVREIARLGKDLHGWNVAYAPAGHGGRGNWSELSSAGPTSAVGGKVLYDRADRNELDFLGEDQKRDQRDAEGVPAFDDDGLLAPAEEAAQELDAPFAARASVAKEKLSMRERKAGFLSKDSYSRRESSLRYGLPARREWRTGSLAEYGFPELAPPAPDTSVLPEPKWDREIIEVLRSLDRTKELAALAGGLSFTSRNVGRHAVRGHALWRYDTRGVLGKSGWQMRSESLGAQASEEWVLGGKRGVAFLATRLGRERDAGELDRARVPMPLQDLSLSMLLQGYTGYDPKLTRSGDIAIVTFTAKRHTVEMRIDTTRRVLIESKSWWSPTSVHVTRFERFVPVAGHACATLVTQLDGQGRTLSTQELTFEEIGADALASALTAGAAARADVLLVPAKDPELPESKQALAESRASFAQTLRVAISHASTQLWEPCFATWEKAKPLAAAKPGLAWIEARFLAQGRKGEELKKHLQALAPSAGQPALAHLVYACANGVLDANEMIGLWDALKGAFPTSGEDAAFHALSWSRTRAQLLEGAGRAREALALFEQIAAANPDDLQATLDLLVALARREDHLGVQRVATTVLATPSRWLVEEQQQLFERWTDALFARAPLAELRRVLELWIAGKPESETAYLRWLSVLLFAGDEKGADAWIAERFAKDLDTRVPSARARLAAAVYVALGQGWHFSVDRIEAQWQEPLAALARELARNESDESWIAQQIVTHWRFRQTDAYAQLRKDLIADLSAKDAIATWPITRLTRYIGWIDWSRAQVDPALWRLVTDAVKARHAATSEINERQALAAQVFTLLDAHGETKEALAFGRQYLREADATRRPEAAHALLQRLANEPFSEAIESEMLSLLAQLEHEEYGPEQRRRTLADALRWLTDELERMRLDALLGEPAAREKLTREELAAKTRDARRALREGLAKRYARARDEAAPHARPWLELERLCLLVQLGAELAALEGEARELLGGIPADTEPDSIQQVLRARAVLVLMAAAVHKQAPAGLADRVVALLGERAKDEAGRRDLALLLVALDRADALIAQLRAWIVPTKVQSEWRTALGYLLAESGKLADAVAVFEGAQALDELSAAEHTALAAWHLVLGDDARRAKALLRAYEVRPEHELSAWLWREHARVQRLGDHVPEALNPETFLVLRALLGKASQPSQYLHQIQALYQATKDFRLLESVADGVLGHSVQGIYPFVSGLMGMLQQVHEEATCDSIRARIAARAADAKGDVDRRALALLMVLVERRAAEVKNQPGPHATRALDALRAASRGEWAPGERGQMAAFLAGLGRIPDAQLSAEQMRQLDELLRAATERAERLAIATACASTHWAYEKKDLAIDSLHAALSEHRQNGGGIDERLSATLTLTDWLAQAARFAEAEALLERSLEGSASHTWRALDGRLVRLYVECLARDGSLSLGRGLALYTAARTRLSERMFRCGEERIDELVQTFCELHRIAHEKRVGQPGKDLLAFARAELKEIETIAPNQASQVVMHVTRMIRVTATAADALAVSVERIEREPRWLVRTGQDLWQRDAWQLAQWRDEARASAALEQRLLAIVVRELERDLVETDRRQDAFYDMDHQYAWRAHKDTFKRVVDKVLELRADSAAITLCCANVLWEDLKLFDAAIDALARASDRSRLEPQGRHTLVIWMHERKRFTESLPHIDVLVAARPEELAFRMLKVRALHETGRDAQAFAWLDATEKLWKETKRWDEGALATIASTCQASSFFERAARCYEEAIPLHQRTAQNRGIGDGTLCSYYDALARCYAQLGRHDQAVDAASAAVVSWGPNAQNRKHALEALEQALASVPDLPAWLARRDAEVAKSGADAPLLRKTAGMLLLKRKQHAQAAAQLELARTLQPNDAEVDAMLLLAYDALRDAPNAERMLRALGHFAELGSRLATRGDAQAAERAWTNVVEAKPDEAESHRTLAEHRKAQDRFGDAITQLQEVVRIRALEPDGLLAQAEVQLMAGKKDDARATIDHVLKTEWEPRFADAKQKAAALLAR